MGSEISEAPQDAPKKPKEEKTYEERLREQRQRREENPDDVGEINQENLTDYSKWSTELLEDAKNKMAEIPAFTPQMHHLDELK